MKIKLEKNNQAITADLNRFYDLSIPISAHSPRAWYVQAPVIKPVINQHFVGSVQLGGKVNFRDVSFNPHGHGTHTECVGHITQEWVSIHEMLNAFFFWAKVISITPSRVSENEGWSQQGDYCITKDQLMDALANGCEEAVVIRTLPNDCSKLTANYSDTNFCYLHRDATAWLAEQGVKHLLLDLPSVDREVDGGELLAHRAWWMVNNEVRKDATITEMVFVDNSVADGLYLLNLQVAAFDNDAAPSRPLLFPLEY
jgi:arylformamidase